MMKRVFKIEAIWDEEAGVFFSKSDIEGLHIEAENIEEFLDIMMDVAPELIVANHFHNIQDELPLEAILPAILFEQSQAKPVTV